MSGGFSISTWQANQHADLQRRGTCWRRQEAIRAYSARMKTLLALAAAAALAGCGVETASTAATAASIKKQELEQGQKTMQQSQQKIDAAAQAMQQTRTGPSE